MSHGYVVFRSQGDTLPRPLLTGNYSLGLLCLQTQIKLPVSPVKPTVVLCVHKDQWPVWNPLELPGLPLFVTQPLLPRHTHTHTHTHTHNTVLLICKCITCQSPYMDSIRMMKRGKDFCNSNGCTHTTATVKTEKVGGSVW